MSIKHPIPAAVLALWRQGDKVEALRALRASTGLGLKEAKAALDADPGHANASATALRAVLAAMARGDETEAVRLASETTGLGHAEAKGAVADAMAGRPTAARGARTRSHRALSPGEVPHSRVNGLVLAALVALAVAAVLWLRSWFGR